MLAILKIVFEIYCEDSDVPGTFALYNSLLPSVCSTSFYGVKKLNFIVKILMISKNLLYYYSNKCSKEICRCFKDI